MIFEGGFLGLDNIGVIDRNQLGADGSRYEQADATSWMAMFSLNMMRIALELATSNPVYQEMAIKFFDHFLYIGEAIEDMNDQSGLWDEKDQFIYTKENLKKREIEVRKLNLSKITVDFHQITLTEAIEEKINPFSIEVLKGFLFLQTEEELKSE